MLFNSPSFLFLFLPIVLVVAKQLKGQRLLGWIVLSSFIFYAFAGHWWFLLPMAFTTIVDFFLAQKIQATTDYRRKKLLLATSLTLTLGLLAYFKYAGLFFDTTDQFISAIFNKKIPESLSPYFRVVLPAGISFYSFQTISYILDVYQETCEAETNFFRFAGFISFFPHLIAGPLTRHNQLVPQLQKISECGIKSRWKEGFFLFAIGLAKKVLIGDRIGNIIDPMLTHVPTFTFLQGWLTTIGYGMQIYFDFSGYSDMAIGLGRLFGVELPQNFNRPYTSLNPSDFWHRWHITLSYWLRDYIYSYIALSGPFRDKKWRLHFNLVATMFLGGLWHGAGWTYAAWGAYHGLLLSLYHATRRSWDRWNKMVQRVVTFILVILGYILFRATSFSEARQWFAACFGLKGFSFDLAFFESSALLLGLLGVAFAITYGLPNASNFPRFETLSRKSQVALGVLAALTVLWMNNSSKFLYFQF